MNIQAVIFDRDNTLIRFDPSAAAVLEARIAVAAPSLPFGVIGQHWANWPGPWPRSAEQEPEFWHSFWEQLATQYRLSADTRATLHQIGMFYHTCFVAFPDTLACLAALRARGLRLAILSNFELPSIHLTLQNAGIDPGWFSALLSSTSIGFSKPDSRAYLAATAALGLEPSACAFVDDLTSNVEAAQALGIRSWLLDRPGTASPGATPRIRDLSQLISQLNISQDEIDLT
jgi:HAD superfamily hydrolase (TIGR01509 family)